MGDRDVSLRLFELKFLYGGSCWISEGCFGREYAWLSIRSRFFYCYFEDRLVVFFIFSVERLRFGEVELFFSIFW